MQQYQYASGLVLLIGLVLTAQAQAQLVNVATIIGELCCARNGSCDVPGALPLVGVNYTVTCTTALGLTVVVGHGTTTADGGINVTVPLPAPVLSAASAILRCNVTVPLPISDALCPVLSITTGFLTGAIQLVRTTLSGLICTTLVFIRLAL